MYYAKINYQPTKIVLKLLYAAIAKFCFKINVGGIILLLYSLNTENTKYLLLTQDY